MPGGLYHIYSRGLDRVDIFSCDADREKFLGILADTIRHSSWKCFAYCLMSNHYHILIESEDGDTSVGMKRLNGSYAQYYNWKHERTGPLFQGRYKAILVDRENYFMELCRYIVLNPVKAGLVADPGKYPWSSYRCTAGLDPTDDITLRDTVLGLFDPASDSSSRSSTLYVEFVRDGILDDSFVPNPHAELVLGNRDFLKEVGKQLEVNNDPEIPKFQRMAFRPPLSNILDPLTVSIKEIRNTAVRKAYRNYGYTQTEIARYLGVHNSTVFRIIHNINNNNH